MANQTLLCYVSLCFDIFNWITEQIFAFEIEIDIDIEIRRNIFSICFSVSTGVSMGSICFYIRINTSTHRQNRNKTGSSFENENRYNNLMEFEITFHHDEWWLLHDRSFMNVIICAWKSINFGFDFSCFLVEFSTNISIISVKI